MGYNASMEKKQVPGVLDLLKTNGGHQQPVRIDSKTFQSVARNATGMFGKVEFAHSQKTQPTKKEETVTVTNPDGSRVKMPRHPKRGK